MRSTDLFRSKCEILLISHRLCYVKRHFVEKTNFLVNKMLLFELTEFFSQLKKKSIEFFVRQKLRLYFFRRLVLPV